jgi:hypothetical protein
MNGVTFNTSTPLPLMAGKDWTVVDIAANNN